MLKNIDWRSWFSNKRPSPRGMDLINSVADRFNDMVAELDEGICHCQEERNGICAAIDRLRARDSALSESSNKAQTIADNLRTLLGV